MVLNGKNGGFFLDLDSSDAQPVTLDLGPDKEPEETTPEEPSSPMTLTVSRADDSAPSSDDKVVQRHQRHHQLSTGGNGTIDLNTGEACTGQALPDDGRGDRRGACSR